MQITEQNVRDLEQHHGTGIIVLSVGDQDFAFRRPTETEVSYALAAQANNSPNYLEDLALGCLLSAAAPQAGTPAGVGADGSAIPRNAGVSADDKALLVTEKERLEALWEAGQFYRDAISGQFAFECGWALEVDGKPIGGGTYEIALASSLNAKRVGADLNLKVTATKASRPIYDKYKQLELNGNEGEPERYLWDKLVQAQDKGEIARLYPFAVIALGRFLPGLGCDQGTVRVKKFSAGPAPVPGISTEPPASAASSA